MLKAIRYSGHWFFPQIDYIKVWSNNSGDNSVRGKDLSNGRSTQCSVWIVTPDSSGKGYNYYGFLPVIGMTFNSGQLWIHVQEELVSHQTPNQMFIKLDDVLQSDHMELQVGGVKWLPNPLVVMFYPESGVVE